MDDDERAAAPSESKQIARDAAPAALLTLFELLDSPDREVAQSRSVAEALHPEP
jgi:hypothetical protein